MLSKKLAAIDKTRCVACGVCENTCPLGAVKVRRGCYAAVEAERCVCAALFLCQGSGQYGRFYDRGFGERESAAVPLE